VDGQIVSGWGPFDLTGKVAVVTGAAAGIGLGITKSLHTAGAKVLGVGRRPEGNQILSKVDPQIAYLQADLAELDAPARIVDEAVRLYGRIDILVNNAAALGNTPISALTAEEIDDMAAVNIRAVLLLSRAFVSAREGADGTGRIVNIASIEGGEASLVPAGMAAYSATKTAVRGITVTLARELGPLGIGVNAIAPGAVMHENLLSHGETTALSADEITAILQGMLARTNVGRLGTPDDIGNICVFLASSASDYISGQIITADGGTTRT